MSAIFLSYAHDDAWIMRAIRSELQARGFPVWVDENLVPGEPSWKNRIGAEIEQCGCVVVILTENAKVSPWIERELGYADTHRKPVIPVLARGSVQEAVPLELINAQWIDIGTDYSGSIQRLISTVSRYVKPEYPNLHSGVSTATRWDRTGSLFWLKHDFLVLRQALEKGGISDIQAAARQTHWHLFRLQLGEKIVGNAQALKNEVDSLVDEDLTPETRRRLRAITENIHRVAGDRIFAHDPDWAPFPPE